MDWLTRLFPPYRTPAEERRAKETDETLTLVDEFLAEMRESISDLQATADEDRKGYPLASALRRRPQ